MNAAAGRVVLVLGASRGIGAAIAAAFAAAGGQLVLVARDRAALDEVAARITDAGHTPPLPRPADVTDEDGLRRVVDEIADRFGRLDVAINSAGGSVRPPAPLQAWSVAEFRASVEVNLIGTFLSMKYELDLMSRTGGGVVINVSSTAGQQPVAGLSGYVAGKYGVEGLTRVAALDCAASGVRVVSLAPGPILTERLAAAGPEGQAAAAAAVPLGRLGTVDDVASAALWLAAPGSGFITGTTVTVDGGRLAGVPPFRMGASGATAAPRPSA